MPPLETTDRQQWAVIWEYVGQNGYGLPVVSQPVEMLVRWVDKVSQVSDPTGNTLQSNAQIITQGKHSLQSIAWKGRLKDLTPSPLQGLHILIKDETTPDIKNRNNRYEYALMRYTQKLPDLTGT